jgi:H+-transporting ATPase
MFLQIVLGGHFMLYSTRTAKWFFQPPLPSLSLSAALWATNVLAIVMCAFGWLGPRLSWTTIGWVLAYSVAWLVVMDIAKRGTYSAIDHRSGRQAAKHRRLVTQSLQPRGPGNLEPARLEG